MGHDTHPVFHVWPHVLARPPRGRHRVFLLSQQSQVPLVWHCAQGWVGVVQKENERKRTTVSNTCHRFSDSAWSIHSCRSEKRRAHSAMNIHSHSPGELTDSWHARIHCLHQKSARNVFFRALRYLFASYTWSELPAVPRYATPQAPSNVHLLLGWGTLTLGGTGVSHQSPLVHNKAILPNSQKAGPKGQNARLGGGVPWSSQIAALGVQSPSSQHSSSLLQSQLPDKRWRA
jgi:hypothetical protein